MAADEYDEMYCYTCNEKALPHVIHGPDYIKWKCPRCKQMLDIVFTVDWQYGMEME